MNFSDTETCPDCGQSAVGGLIFHELYCYDVYVVSAPAPQNPKQAEIDKFMIEKIVKHLESNGLKCYLGSRDICGGEHVIPALSNPITIIPTTIVPVYKDRSFSAFRNLLLRVDYLDRIVFLMFDSTPIEPPVVSKNCFSINIDDKYLLSKLRKTIEKRTLRIPLNARRLKYEKSNPGSAVSSTIYEFHRNTHFRRSDGSRISFRVKHSAVPNVSEVGSFSPEMPQTDHYSNTVLPQDLLSFCHSSIAIKSQYAAKTLARTIRKDIPTFSKKDNLEEFEKQIRYLRQKENAMDFEILYFWITAAIFYRIYRYQDYSLKVHMKMVTLSKCKPNKNKFEELCQETYRRLTASLLAKIKIWPNRLDINEQYVKKCEDCLLAKVPKSFEKLAPSDILTKTLGSLPWDIKHIFIVTIAEKLFQKNYTDSSVFFFSHICNTIGKKHWPVFIDVLERVIDYMLHTYTKEPLLACLKLLKNIVTWNSRTQRKNDKLNFVLKHMIRKLVYHPVDLVRNYVSSLVFGNGSIPVDISQLGCCSLKVNEDLVEECIFEYLHHSYPALTIQEQVPSYSAHTLMFEAKTPEGDSLLCVFRQQTLNDVLNTNSTDAAYESFQEMLRAIEKCQGHDNIVALRNVPSNGVLPFCVVEHGKPLLSFLHEKENQLTWTQMLDILIDITKAVHYCHNNNVILREITPASFVIVPKENGSFQTKLTCFLYAECLVKEEPENEAEQYIEDIDFFCFEGDRTEVIAAYFSAPETLHNKTFSKYSEAWMLAATFYSILLYGKCPFQELAHLSVFQFINEIISGHTVRIPRFLPEDLSEILRANLNIKVQERMMTETLLDKLEACKFMIGTRKDTVHAERTVCQYINLEDILRGYVDKEQFVQEHREGPMNSIYEDKTTLLNGMLTETVSGRMSLSTRRKLQKLNHKNILGVKEIKSNHCITTLISKAFEGHGCRLSNINSDILLDELFSYFEQITVALLELHSHNIVHCDLRCDHIYINKEKGTVKISHLGRAVSLEGRQTYAFKMMPPDAKKWSAPEVRASHMYSKASDIFSLAVVFWEAISTQKAKIYAHHPLQPFHQCKTNMEEYADINVPDEWKDSINEMLKCMQKCWNPNQTKRPTVDVILNKIQQIRKDMEQYWSFAGHHTYGIDMTSEIEENSQDVVYDTVIEKTDFRFSIDYIWGKIVKEFTTSRGIENNTFTFIEVKETCAYEDVGLPTTKSKTRFNYSSLL